jgi:NAD(P)-dependent dehydrogenase (short-subunit alcohol dehydrogenase family)
MQELYPDLPRLKPEELAELHTLREVGDHLLAAYASTHAAPPAAPAPAPAGNGAPAQQAAAPAAAPDLPHSAATLRTLPAPDALETAPPAGYSCLLTSDGTPLTAQMTQELTSRGWKVVVLSFPHQASTAVPGAAGQVALRELSEEHLAATLQHIAATYGPVGAFMHLHPPMASNLAGGGVAFAPEEEAIVKYVFLLARSLKPGLNEAAQAGRSFFVTVVRLDGAFGLGQESDYSALGGGLFGLTKSLNLEWEPVFCRAIDLSASISPTQAAQHIVAEMYDPNRLITEVGYGAQGRVTLVGA